MIAVRSLKSEVCRGHIMPYNDSGTPGILVFPHNKRTQPKKLNFFVLKNGFPGCIVENVEVKSVSHTQKAAFVSVSHSV